MHGPNGQPAARLDPVTGAIKEYPLETPRSGPRGLVDDQNGHIRLAAHFAAISATWSVFFDLFGTNKIAGIDRQSAAIKQYPAAWQRKPPARIAEA